MKRARPTKTNQNRLNRAKRSDPVVLRDGSPLPAAGTEVALVLPRELLLRLSTLSKRIREQGWPLRSTKLATLLLQKAIARFERVPDSEFLMEATGFRERPN